jgi:hypothetical protein
MQINKRWKKHSRLHEKNNLENQQKILELEKKVEEF